MSRGETFENEKYITLWPVDEVHENHVSEIINGLHLPVDFEGKLIALSEIVCIFVTRELMGNQRVLNIMMKVMIRFILVRLISNKE